MMTKLLFRLAVIVLAFPLASCASISAPIDGVVIDTTTNKPIPGAFVIAQWVRHGSDGFGSRTSCPHVEVVQADAGGRYTIPEAPFLGLNVERQVFSYKSAYEWFLLEPYDQKLMTMRPFKGTGDERVESYRTYGSLQACGPDEKKVQALQPLYQAIDEEAKMLVVKDSSRYRLGGFLRDLQRIEELIANEKRSK